MYKVKGYSLIDVKAIRPKKSKRTKYLRALVEKAFEIAKIPPNLGKKLEQVDVSRYQTIIN